MKAIKILLAIAAVAAASVVMVGATVTLEVASNVAPAADATLIDCGYTSLFDGQTGLRTGYLSICYTTYGAKAQQSIRVTCYDGDYNIYYYKYGAWVGEDRESFAYCDNGYDVAVGRTIRHRNV